MSWASRAGAASGGFFWRGGEAGAVRGGVDKKNCHAGNAAAAAAASRSRSTTRPAHGHGSGAAAAGGGSKASINGGGGGGGGGGSGGGRGGRGGSGGNGRGFTRFVVAGVAVSAVAGAAITWVNASGGDGLGLLDSASSSTPTFASNSNSKSPEAAAAASAAASDGVPVDTSADTAAAASSSSSATGSEDGARDLSAADAAAHRAAVDMWRSRWDEGNVGFHLPAAHHLLVRYKTALLGEGVTSPPELSKRIFVPLCGKAVDMLWLVRRSRQNTVCFAALRHFFLFTRIIFLGHFKNKNTLLTPGDGPERCVAGVRALPPRAIYRRARGILHRIIE